MRAMILLITSMVSIAPVAAQQTGTALPTQQSPQTPPIKRSLPKLSSPADDFNVQTTDTGRQIDRRLELQLPNSKDTFIFGDKTTSYPLNRAPGDVSRPLLPEQDHYSIGIGKRF